MNKDPTPKTASSVPAAIKRVLRVSLIVYTLVIIVLGFLQRQLLYSPRVATNLSVSRYPELMQLFPAATDVSVKCADGVTIRGWLLQTDAAASPNSESGKAASDTSQDAAAAVSAAADDGETTQEAGPGTVAAQSASVDGSLTRRPLVLYMHGNAGNRSGRGSWYRIFHAAGADVLAFDYHGYGDSEGSMSQQAMLLDCDAAWSFATETLGYQPADIIVAGTSLGGAAAVYTAAQASRRGQIPASLLLVATFSSMVDVAGSLYWWVPVRALLVDRYPAGTWIPDVTCPVVVMHGDQDALVGQQFGRKLFDAAASEAADGTPKTWVNMPGITHDNIISEGGDQVQTQANRLVQQWRTSRQIP